MKTFEEYKNRGAGNLVGSFVNVIYTFDSLPQKFIDLPIPQAVLKNEKSFKDYLVATLYEREYTELRKISTCIFLNHKKLNIPKWYEECNGKFYYDYEPK